MCVIQSDKVWTLLQNSASSSDESDSDCYKEPASKYPRLSGKEKRLKSYNRQQEDWDSSEVSSYYEYR